MQWHGVSFYVKFKTQKQQMPLSLVYLSSNEIWLRCNYELDRIEINHDHFVETKRGKNYVLELDSRWFLIKCHKSYVSYSP